MILPNIEEPDDMSWFVFVVRLSDVFGHVDGPGDRGAPAARRGERELFSVHPPAVYREQFGYKKGDFPIAESIADRTIALPFFNKMDETTIELVVQTLKVMLQRERLLKPS